MRNLSYENEFCTQFHFHANQSHFHKNGFALRLALKQRHKGTRKWPIWSVGFCGGRKTGEPRRRKTLRARTRTNNKLNPHVTPGPGIEPRPQQWEASALTTAPFLHPLGKRLSQCLSSPRCIKRVPTNLMLGVTLRWTASYPLES